VTTGLADLQQHKKNLSCNMTPLKRWTTTERRWTRTEDSQSSPEDMTIRLQTSVSADHEPIRSRYDTIDDLHWKTDRQAASLM